MINVSGKTAEEIVDALNANLEREKKNEKPFGYEKQNIYLNIEDAVFWETNTTYKASLVYDTPDSFTVTFNTFGFGSEVFTQRVHKGEKLIASENTQEQGLTFNGWYTEPEFINKFDFNTPVTSDFTLYAKWIGKEKYFEFNETCGHTEKSVDVLKSTHIISADNIPSKLNDGWCIVDGTVTTDTRVEISGNVKLILRNGSHFILNSGIKLEGGNSLTLYAQTTDDTVAGKLTAYGKGLDAAIGGSAGEKAGTFIMQGGIIYAEAENGAGIGGKGGDRLGIILGNVTYGYSGGAGGSLTVNGGHIVAQSSFRAIGGDKGDREVEGFPYGNPGADAVVDLYADTTVTGQFNQDSSVEIITNGKHEYKDENGDDFCDLCDKNLSCKYLSLKDDGTFEKLMIPENATEITEPITSLSGGWYFIRKSITVESGITVPAGANVHLILCDNAELTAKQGIVVSNGASFSIYATSDGCNMGKLTATGSSNPGIGAAKGSTGGSITIYGGHIYAKGAELLAWYSEDGDGFNGAANGEHIDADGDNICDVCKKTLIVVGDLNDDGEITADDLALLKKALLTNAEYSEILDCNGDENFDLLDLVRLKKHLADETVPLGKQETKQQTKQLSPEVANLPDEKPIA